MKIHHQKDAIPQNKFFQAKRGFKLRKVHQKISNAFTLIKKGHKIQKTKKCKNFRKEIALQTFEYLSVGLFTCFLFLKLW